MAQQTLSPEQYDRIVNANKEKPQVKIAEAVQATKTAVIYATKISIGFLDGLILLVIVFWYFFFTGLCLLFGRKLPKQWLALARDLNGGRIARKVKQVGKSQEQVPNGGDMNVPTIKKKRFRVVDLESRPAIKTS